MNKKEIKNIFDSGTAILNNIRINIGEERFKEFLMQSIFYYNGCYVGNSLNDFLAEAVYYKLTEKERAEFNEWYNKHFSVITSPIEHGPRGEYYDYVMCFNGKIYAIGDEQGNYAGGITASMNNCDRCDFAKRILHFKSENASEHQKQLYEKIKNTPIITEEEFQQMKEQRKKWPKDFGLFSWFE